MNPFENDLSLKQAFSECVARDRKNKVIRKKILPEFFKPFMSAEKNFEIRKDEDDVQVGDYLFLDEWDGEKYTGNFGYARVKYVLRNCPQYGLMEGYCIIGF